jgi:hypothetical protein
MLLDCALANLDPQFQELATDAFRTPQSIFLDHFPDQINGFLGNAWLSLLVL